ncbi:camphor resistance protein CrcB [Caballeronia turbans]|nr:camphor resistance protein CrcB [Caballeronia turbans]
MHGVRRARLERAGEALKMTSTGPLDNNGVVTIASAHGAVAAADRLEALIRARGLMLFARIDFSGDAARAGLTMPPSQLLVFGNPQAGTPLMQAVPTAALDLPLKVLSWEDANGRAWLSYNATEYLRARHGLDADAMKPVSGVAALVEAAAR